jgi:2-dehydropantoate 2-reductase
MAVKETIHILGGGNIACFLAHHLCPFTPITLLLRPQALTELRTRRGKITVSSSFNPTITEITVSSSPADSPSESPIQSLLVATKAHHTISALTPLIPHISSETNILLLQNGLGLLPKVRQLLLHAPRGSPQVDAGITTWAVNRTHRFDVTLAGEEGDLVYSTPHPHSYLSRTLLLASSLNPSCIPTEDLRSRQIEKLAQNATVNAVTSIKGCKNGELLENPEAMEMMRGVVAELAEVMRCGEGERERLWGKVVNITYVTRSNWSSMMQDVRAGRETEIGWINGWIVEKGREVGVPTPVNEMLVERVMALGGKGR